MNNLTIVVKEEHLSFFYTLMGRYHLDPSDFVTTYERLGLGNDGNNKGPGRSPGESSQDQSGTSGALSPEKTQSFYSYIIGNCTCAKCYKTFARPDRVPWRSSAKSNVFTNSKHGIVRVTNCPVSKFEGCGYLYESLNAASSQIKLDEYKARQEIAIKKDKASLKEAEDKAKITSLKVSEAKSSANVTNNKAKELAGAVDEKHAKKAAHARDLELRNDQEFKIWNDVINRAVDEVVTIGSNIHINECTVNVFKKDLKLKINRDSRTTEHPGQKLESKNMPRDTTNPLWNPEYRKRNGWIFEGEKLVRMGVLKRTTKIVSKKKTREQILRLVDSYRFSQHDQLITARATVTGAKVKHNSGTR